MQEKYKKIIKLVIIVIIVYLSFRFLLPLFFPFLLAYMIAWFLRKPVQFLKQKIYMKPMIAGTLLVVFAFFIVGGGIVYVIRLLLKQFVDFATNYDFYETEWNIFLEEICNYCDTFFRVQSGSAFSVLNNGLDGIVLFFQEELIPFITKHSLRAAISVTELVATIIVIFVASLLFLSDMTSEKRIGKQNNSFFLLEWKEVKKELSGAGIAYLKTQVILIILISLTCSIGFFIIENPYALLFGVMIGILDAFPILGSGMILVPWAIIYFIRGRMLAGAVLLTLYGICQFFREYLEPKLLGGKMGVRPVHSLMAVYVGYELFGICGIFLGPMGLVLIKSLWRVT